MNQYYDTNDGIWKETSKPICPHCCMPYNDGAAVCYNCRSYIDFKSWWRMNGFGVSMTVIIILLSFTIVPYCVASWIEGKWIILW